jgi:serine/threonine protein kinase
MNEPNGLNRTVDVSSVPADSPRVVDALVTTDHVPGSASTDASHPTADAACDLPAVPGYHVLREIARGGMGRVLAAFDLTLDRDVALKILLPGANAERFVRESKITARLPHPGIPPVHALGTLDDGSPFLAMKLIAGQTLEQERKSADRPRLLQAFTQVCQAVGFAHSRGIIHRDLKPANVMVGAFGEVQVMDWGLAKVLGAADVATSGPLVGSQLTSGPLVATDSEATQAGMVMGTPAYMAPEQARGEATHARTDVFALGGILCALLTGQPPYSGKSTLEVVRRAADADLAEANARLDGCGADAELVALCRRCLSPVPADRPADGQAVADGLTTYLDGVQERLHQAELAEAEAKAKALEIDPKNALAHGHMGAALASRGQIAEGINSIEKAIALDPKSGAWHCNLGIMRTMTGQVDRAIACFRKAVELDPKDAIAHYSLGNALYGKGKLDEAVACFRETIELTPKDALAQCDLGRALGQQGRFAESLKAVKRGHALGRK